MIEIIESTMDLVDKQSLFGFNKNDAQIWKTKAWNFVEKFKEKQYDKRYGKQKRRV